VCERLTFDRHHFYQHSLDICGSMHATHDNIAPIAAAMVAAAAARSVAATAEAKTDATAAAAVAAAAAAIVAGGGVASAVVAAAIATERRRLRRRRRRRVVYMPCIDVRACVHFDSTQSKEFYFISHGVFSFDVGVHRLTTFVLLFFLNSHILVFLCITFKTIVPHSTILQSAPSFVSANDFRRLHSLSTHLATTAALAAKEAAMAATVVTAVAAALATPLVYCITACPPWRRCRRRQCRHWSWRRRWRHIRTALRRKHRRWRRLRQRLQRRHRRRR
jgi:hypothetical protein